MGVNLGEVLMEGGEINKIVGSFDEAVRDLFDGATLLIGGFGGFAECPSYLIAAVARKGVKNLTIVGNSAFPAAIGRVYTPFEKKVMSGKVEGGYIC